MSQKLDTSPAVIGMDIGKNSFHIVGQNRHGALPAPEVVAWPGGCPPRQSAATSDRHGGLCRRASPQSYAKGARS